MAKNDVAVGAVGDEGERGVRAADVAVVGGGIAGVYAALAAADHGVRVVLIEQHGFVGGQGTAGGVHGFCGETRLVNRNWSEMLGRLEDLAAIVPYSPDRDARFFDIEYLKFVLQEMLAERGVEVWLHTSLVDVEGADGKVRTLRIFNKSGLQRLACKQVIDASGDADVVAWAGIASEKGGAAYLPDGKGLRLDPAAGKLQLPMSLYFTLIDTGEPVTPVLPKGCPEWDSDAALPMTTIKPTGNNLLSVKMKVIGHDATDGPSLSAAEQQARRQMMGLIYHLQAKGIRGKRYDRHRLAWVAPHIGVREGRRVIGRYRMASSDLFVGRHFEDAVAVGSYHLDYHWPSVAARAGTGIKGMVPPYQIPLRAMRPVEVNNVLVPGRCMSGDQLAMSSYRVMGTCAATGHAAGTAAALALKADGGLDGVLIDDLQGALRSSGVRFDLAPYETYHRRLRYFKEHVFPVPATFAPSHHCSTVVQLPNGEILCSWFGGSREGSSDVGIWISRRAASGEWSEPLEIVKPAGEACYNPVLFLADSKRLFSDRNHSALDPLSVDELESPRLLLYYRRGTHPRTWQTWIMESNDCGETWSPERRMGDGLYGPIKNKPIILANGDWLAASSVESEERNYCMVELSTDQGETWTVSAPFEDAEHPLALIQPTVWESTPGHVHLLMRNRTVREYGCEATLWRADSTDNGRTWSKPYPTDLPSNDSGIDVAVMVPSPGDPGYENGGLSTLALVLNPVSTRARSPLAVWLSYDNGVTWPDRAIVEDDPTAIAGFSYPSIIPCAAGFLLSYTWKRQGIVCMRFCPQNVQCAAEDGKPLSLSGDPLQAVKALCQEEGGHF